jgi:hypothetical protein
MHLVLGDGTRVPIHSNGIIELYFNSRVLILSNSVYITSICMNLICVTFLGNFRYSSILRYIGLVKKGNLFIFCYCIIVDGLYIITPGLYSVNNYVLEPT